MIYMEEEKRVEYSKEIENLYEFVYKNNSLDCSLLDYDL